MSIFDEEDANYKRNIEAYDRIAETIENSKMLGKILSTGKMYDMLSGVFSSFNDSIYVPRYITYENTESGYGEMHWLLYGLRSLGSKANRDLLSAFTGSGQEAEDGNGDYGSEGLESLVKANDGEDAYEDDDDDAAKNALKSTFELIAKATGSKDEYGNTLATYMTESVYLRSLISAIMISQSEAIYVPQTVLEFDESGQVVNLIQKSVISGLFDSLTNADVRTAMLDFIDADEDDSSSISKLVKNDAVAEILCGGNGIIEGTVAKQIALMLQDTENVKVPYALRVDKDGNLPDGWLTKNNMPGELSRLVRALRLEGFDIGYMVDNGVIQNATLKDIINSDPEASDVLMASDILHYTLSDSVLTGNIKFGGSRDLIVPINVKVAIDGSYVILKSEMSALCKTFAKIDIPDSTAADSNATRNFMNQLISIKDSIGDSAILSASMANYLVAECGNGGILNSSGLVIPTTYADAADKESLEKIGSSARMWKEELSSFAYAAEILFGSDGNIVVNGELIASLSGSNHDFVTVYKSRIIAATITDKIRNISTGAIADHPYAYEKGFEGEIYSASEVSAILHLLNVGNIDKLEEFALTDARELRQFILDGTGNTQSWLLTATLSNRLLKNNTMYVPQTVILKDGTNSTVNPVELVALIDAFEMLNGNDENITLDNWEPNLVVPTVDQMKTMLESIILRATITNEIAVQNKGNLYVQAQNVTVAKRVYYVDDETLVDGDAPYIDADQLSAIFAVLRAVRSEGEESFEMPSVATVDAIYNLSDEDLRLYVASDVLRLRLSRLLEDVMSGTAPESKWCKLSANGAEEEDIGCRSAEDILTFIRDNRPQQTPDIPDVPDDEHDEWEE